VIRNLSILAGEISWDRFNTDLRLFAPEVDELSPAIGALMSSLKNYVVCVPGSMWNTKRWSTEGFRDVVKHFIKTGYKVVLSGSPAEKPLLDTIASGMDVINIAGMAKIHDAMYVTRHARLVVCNDSMALHMASAFKVPNVAVFCATSPDFGFSPWKNKSIVVQREDLSCRPCQRHGGNTCPTGTWECINGLPARRVIDAIEALLG
jgi:heptosyltransferase-2